MEDKKYTILITDDEKSNLLVLAGILSPKYNILTAKSGARALALAKEQAPDLILLDVIMPGMSGFGVIAKLKESAETDKIPVIFITGLSDADSEEKGLLLGAVDYITKPFNKDIVKARVNTHIRIIDQMRVIERMGLIDPLTKIINRRGFETRLDIEWYRALREQSPISVFMMDIDKFKNYNDTYGHLQGDSALKAVAGKLSQALKRSSDLAARWGGEEFIGLMPNSDAYNAFEVAEQLRQSIAAAIIPAADGTETSVTVSIGINTVVPSSDTSTGDFIKYADKALYRAKETGRNRVCNQG